MTTSSQVRPFPAYYARLAARPWFGSRLMCRVAGHRYHSVNDSFPMSDSKLLVFHSAIFHSKQSTDYVVITDAPDYDVVPRIDAVCTRCGHIQPGLRAPAVEHVGPYR